MNDNQTLSVVTKEGYVVDYISGQEVKATPEEINHKQQS